MLIISTMVLFALVGVPVQQHRQALADRQESGYQQDSVAVADARPAERDTSVFSPLPATYHQILAGQVEIAVLQIATFLDAQPAIDEQGQARFITSPLYCVADQDS